jgi:glucose-6-phosphate dehydrogenase assembly protein OpcA
MLSVWSEESVRLGSVLAALESLRAPELLPPTRTSVLNLVIVTADHDAALRAQEAVHELGGRHPTRVIGLVLDPDAEAGPPGLDAEIRLLGGEAEGHELWFEDVQLHVHGPACAHLDSLIEPLTLSDLPVVVWFPDELPALDDPLLTAADVVLADSRALGGLDCFAGLAGLVAILPVVDLSWVRLQPWREQLAGLFEGPAFRPFVHGVRAAEVSGHSGPRHLLGGWLTDRLQLPPGRLHLEAAEHVTIRLHAEDGSGRHGSFEVTRGDERRVSARADVDGGPTAEAVVQLPEATAAWGLPDALARLERDPVYERALARALPLESPA